MRLTQFRVPTPGFKSPSIQSGTTAHASIPIVLLYSPWPFLSTPRLHLNSPRRRYHSMHDASPKDHSFPIAPFTSKRLTDLLIIKYILPMKSISNLFRMESGPLWRLFQGLRCFGTAWCPGPPNSERLNTGGSHLVLRSSRTLAEQTIQAEATLRRKLCYHISIFIARLTCHQTHVQQAASIDAPSTTSTRSITDTIWRMIIDFDYYLREYTFRSQTSDLKYVSSP